MELVIEAQGRDRKSARQLVLDQAEIRIGRAYDNDVILNDPYVSPHHAVLKTGEDGRLRIQDLGSVNGVYDHRHRKQDGELLLASGDSFVLGQTRLRLFRRDHPVAPAISLRVLDTVLRRIGRPQWVGALLVTLFLVTLGFEYLGAAGEFKILAQFKVGLVLLALGVLWVLMWALVSRLSKHEAQFLLQLAVTLVFLILVPGVDALGNVLRFNLPGATAAFVTTWLLPGAMLWALVWTNLYLGVMQTPRSRAWVAGVVAGGLLAFVFAIDIDEDDFSASPEYDGTIVADLFQWRDGDPAQAFLGEASRVFDAAQAEVDDQWGTSSR